MLERPELIRQIREDYYRMVESQNENTPGSILVHQSNGFSFFTEKRGGVWKHITLRHSDNKRFEIQNL